jgi:hypothetical protein
MKCNDYLQLIEMWTLNYNNTLVTKKKNAIHLTLSLKKIIITYYYLYVCQTIDQGRADLQIENMCQLFLCHSSK